MCVSAVVTGNWLLATGYWLLATGYWLRVSGKSVEWSNDKDNEILW